MRKGARMAMSRVPLIPAFRRSCDSRVRRRNEPRKAKGTGSKLELVPLFDRKSLDGGGLRMVLGRLTSGTSAKDHKSTLLGLCSYGQPPAHPLQREVGELLSVGGLDAS